LNTALETISLHVGYHKQVSLFENLNLSLHAGELVCFMGPNGAGKSSLIRTLAGLQQPLSGTVSGNDRIVDAKQIALVLTDRISVGNMTAYELISFGRYPYLDWRVNLTRADEEIINRAIANVRVEHLIKKKLDQLSDGELQMIMITKALSQDTPIILLDEPTAHLDLNNRVEIMRLLRKLAHKMNKAILIATHDLDLALQMADMIWLAGKEKNILAGLPEDLVLDGSFDKIFQFKGFDLKSGKIEHAPYRDVVINLEGKGASLLWTKNALERCGFMVETSERTQQSSNTIHVKIETEESKPRWILDKDNRLYTLYSISALIKHI
jgi:iron complex transport system ATP-binding protein